MRPLLLAAVLFLTAGGGARAQADVRFEWMKAAHQRAMAHFAARRWDPAMAELRAAYALWPAAGALYDEGVCRERKGDKRGAAELYRRYLQAAQSPPDRGFVEKRVAALSLGLDGQPIDPAGVLLVESMPPGMTVYVDVRGGAPVGRTPWNGHLDGKHTVILAAQGFEDAYKAVDVEPLQVLAVRIEARPRPDAARLQITANIDGARVSFDDKQRGSAGVTPLDLPITVGRHTLVISRTGFSDARREVVVGPRESASLAVTLVPSPKASAAAVVTGVPGARVLVDGKQVCAAAPCLFEVSEGKHRVRVTKPGLGTWEKQLVLESFAETGIELSPGRPWQATVTSKPVD